MILSIFLVIMMAGTGEDPYVLILTNNKQMKVAQAPDCDDKVCKVLLLNGDFTSMPVRMIDLKKTAAFHEEQQRLRDEQSRKQAEAQKALLESGQSEEQKQPEIKLSRYEELPAGDPNENALVNMGASEEEAPVLDQKVKNFASNDPVYVATERVTTYESDYKIECDLKTNEANGVQNVNVRVKVIYSDGLPEETSQSLSKIDPGQAARISFRVKKNGEIVQIGYSIDYDVLETQ